MAVSGRLPHAPGTVSLTAGDGITFGSADRLAKLAAVLAGVGGALADGRDGAVVAGVGVVIGDGLAYGGGGRLDEGLVGIERIAFQDAGTGCLELLLLLELLLQQLVLKPLSTECFGLSHDLAVVEGFRSQRGIGVECWPRRRRGAVPTKATSVCSIRL